MPPFSFQPTHITLISVFAVAHLLLSRSDQSVFICICSGGPRDSFEHALHIHAQFRHFVVTGEHCRDLKMPMARLPLMVERCRLQHVDQVCLVCLSATHTHAQTHTHRTAGHLHTGGSHRRPVALKYDTEGRRSSGRSRHGRPQQPGDVGGGVGAKARSPRLPTIKVLAGCGPTSLGRSRTGTSK